ncbi:cyclase family protein [Bacteriovoracaceae bacterium]|nr:cyclase family protein [Bacteriovoracaceae bacterium]
MKYEIIDISPPISSTSPVFPGDTSFCKEELLSFEKGNHLTLSTIRTTTHIGAHADAPIHYHANGITIEQRNLEYYLGPVNVLDAGHVKNCRILPEHINNDLITTNRVLFKTQSFPHNGPWQNNFTSLSPEIINLLAEKNVKTVGIDTPSVDPANSKELETHRNIFTHNMAILEGIDLDQVEPGEYFLNALPLKIKKGDASPVRAVLLKFK